MKTGQANLKHERMLDMYMRLSAGEIINKEAAATEYHVDTRTIQRDIDDLRDFLSNQTIQRGGLAEIVYDRSQKGFRMTGGRNTSLTNAEVFAVVKILLENRSLVAEEMTPLLNKLLDACVPQSESKRMKVLASNEIFHYIGPHHGKRLLDHIWELSEALYTHRKIRMIYRRMDGITTEKVVKPVGIMASEYYFYLAGFERDNDKKYDGYPTIYRVDRIDSYKILNEHFSIPYKDRIKEGEFRKKMPFMYGGPLTKVEFIYRGKDIFAVLDRFPAAEYKKLPDGSHIIKMEVYGKTGIDMWLGSQGDKVEVVSHQAES